jgi:Rho-binding antiterminator
MISCQLHDYIEIACVYRLKVKATLADDSSQQGTAVDTRTTADKKEYLVLETETGSQQVELEQLKTLKAIESTPHFDEVTF